MKNDIDLVRAHRARLAAARATGERLFMPLLACPRGHTSPRFTLNQCCRQCQRERRRDPDAAPARLAKKQAALRRKIAQQHGQSHYIGAPCKRGHNAQRLVSTRQCVRCLAEREGDRAGVLSPEAARRRLSARRRRVGKAKNRKYQRDVLMNRPTYLTKRFMYAALRRMLGGGAKAARTESLLGYSADALRQRIEVQFAPGMSWENYGEWHIDHRKSLAAFLCAGVTNPATINALCNLRPLWALDNLSKGARIG